MGADRQGQPRFECWYDEYWAQSWYRNTYLVNRPQQIAREIRGERDWNDIYDAGCNFVCVSTILGIDPARLAAELAVQRFFKPDRGNDARDIAGRIVPLVWDQSEPSVRVKRITVRHVWLPKIKRRATLTLRFVAEELTFDHRDGQRIVAAAHRRGEHVIAGARDHSHLVAGRTKDDFYLWDPDDTSVAVEDSLAGRLTLRSLFNFYVDQPIEFWRYTLERRIERVPRPRPSPYFAG
jgi:hypothetical protein